MKKFNFSVVLMFITLSIFGCDGTPPTSDQVRAAEQERSQKEAISQVGMPAIKNFREMKLMKDILEMRDQEGLVTYTYVENLEPKIEPGVTALGGKFTFLGESIGYPIPYSTQFTNPEKIAYTSTNVGVQSLPQAEPNGLFSPPSAEASWVLMKDPSGKKVLPIYMEPRLACFPFPLPLDQAAK